MVTGLEYERLLSASGPNQGHLLRPSDHKEPKRIAWMQCVGSRSTHTCANGYCSTVCCMYAVKQAMVTAEHTHRRRPEPDHLLYGYAQPQQGIRALLRERPGASGVRFIRSRPHTILPGKNNIGVRLAYVTEDGDR